MTRNWGGASVHLIRIGAMAVMLAAFTSHWATEARGDPVFNTFGAGDTYNLAIAYSVTGLTLLIGQDIDTAGKFSVGPSAYTLTGADLALHRIARDRFTGSRQVYK